MYGAKVLSDFEESNFNSFEEYIEKNYKSDKNDIIYERSPVDKTFVPIESESWIDKYAQATAIVRGEAMDAVTKDFDNNNIGNYRTSFLGGNIHYYMSKIEKDDPLRSLSIQHSHIMDIALDTDSRNSIGEHRQVKNMGTAELFHQSIFVHFFGDSNGKTWI